MQTSKIEIRKFPAVSNTALMTLFCHAMDFKAKKSILKNKFAFDLYERIEFDWNKVKKKIFTHDVVFTAIRVRKYDQMCKEFLIHNPNGIIVSLGSGLDYRFERIDNGNCTLVDIELPEVSKFRQMIIPESPRNIQIGQSVLDSSWMDTVKAMSLKNQASVFFIAEGLIPYFTKSEIKELFGKIGQLFHGSELFFDVCGEKTVQMMQKHSGIEEFNAQLKSGFRSGNDFEKMEIGFKSLGDWFYSDDSDAKRGLIMKLIMSIPVFRNWLFFIHGKFD